MRDQHSAQAAGVAIIVSSVLNQPYKRELSIRNDSRLPIYDVRVFLLGSSEPKQKKDVPHILLSRDGKSWQLPTTFVKGGGAYLEFKDSGGAYWRRDSTGKLTELSGTTEFKTISHD
ncbi:hypothetical protein J3A64_001733 [Pseudarthrobacter sp. PvP004]|uniref:hypothetical protein n=1 Tax=Pseudarthrobacter sp. PvP004 TaxID=2817850 RepID=UPI001AE90187|nr:hypothetical protein [Pseudarthrobacter sp. PvP004]MBP2266269.1 hypothetical protein [Pseudarthrobacter sp. PvP004]